MLDIYMISFILFLAFLAVFFYLDRRNVERQGILLLRKTALGKGFLTRLGRGFPKVWWIYGMAAVLAGFAASLWIFQILLTMLYASFFTVTPPPLGILLPSPTAEAVLLPGVIGVPIISWIIALFLLVLVHEGSHGIMAAREGVRIKSLGWGLLVAIPLAFVEPDERQLEKQAPMKQLRVFAAGSFGNFVTYFVFSLIFVLTIPALFAPAPGVGFQSYFEGLPAQQANLTGTIIRIDGTTINDTQDLSRVLDRIGPGRSITITTLVMQDGERVSSDFSLVTARNPGNESDPGGFIGIGGVYNNIEVREGVSPGLAFFLGGAPPGFMGLLFWIILFNFGVGLFNLLPGLPLDGGRMWKIVVDRAFPSRSRQIMSGLTWLTWIVVLLLLKVALTSGTPMF